MKNTNMQSRMTNADLKVALCSGVMAVLALIESLLDLSISIPVQYKWVIFVACLVTSLLFLYRFLSRIPNTVTESEAIEPHTDVLPINSNIAKYLYTVGDRQQTNPVYVHAGKIFLSLNTSQEQSVLGDPLIDQEIHWVLEGKNISDSPMDSFVIVVSLCAFTSWQDNAITIKARLKKTSTGDVYEIEKIEREHGTNSDNEDVRFLKFLFPDGIRCTRSEPFIFEIDMIWNRGCHFQDTERYFSDPHNYGCHMDKLAIEISSNSEVILSRHINLYRVNKGSLQKELVSKSGEETVPQKVHWTVEPRMKELYVIEIVKDHVLALED